MYKGGYQYYDTPIGVLCLESYFPKPPGHVRNPLTYRFPTVCHVLKGIDVARMLFNPNSDILELLVEGARHLEKGGVKAIVGSCGFMGLFQKDLSASVRIPVVSSSLAQLPLLRLMHGAEARIGVLTASAKALTAAHFEAVDANIDNYPIKGMDENRIFFELILEQSVSNMDLEAMENAVCSIAENLHIEHQLDALLMECTDLSAFTNAVQRKINIPIYDINSLVEYVAYSVSRTKYPLGDIF
jgi:aspartate/glutamate racemase